MNIREIRKALGLTQKQLGHRLGVHYLTVVAWEQGKQEPRPNHKKQIWAMTNELPDDKRKELTERIHPPKRQSSITPYIPPKREKIQINVWPYRRP